MVRCTTFGIVIAALAAFPCTIVWAQRDFNHPAPVRKPPEVVGTVEEYQEANTMLVGYAPGSIDRAKEICEGAGLTVKEESRRANYVVCSWANPDVLQKALDTLRKENVLDYAQPNSYLLVDLPKPVYPAAPQQAQRTVNRVLSVSVRTVTGSGGGSGTSRTPNDPFYRQLWSMESIRAPQAWRRATETPVVVAVLDSGVDVSHPDLEANLFRHSGRWNGQVYSNSVGMDFGRFIDAKTGEYFATPQPDPAPIHNPDSLSDGSHGTHCAGTIAAVGDNRVGVAGVSWRARIMALQIFTVVDDKNGDGKRDIVSFHRAQADAIQYAIDNGAKILSNSYGGLGSESPAVRAAIQRANDRGCLFVAAAGNDNNDNDRKKAFPASYGLPNIISVAATSRQDKLARFSATRASNYGAKSVHLGAPGGDMTARTEDGILSTIPPALNENQEYAYYQGTSMACPLVAGAAALVWGQSEYRNYSPAQLRDLLISKSRKSDDLAGKCVSGGVLDISFLASSPSIVPSCAFPSPFVECCPCPLPMSRCCPTVLCEPTKCSKRALRAMRRCKP